MAIHLMARRAACLAGVLSALLPFSCAMAQGLPVSITPVRIEFVAFPGEVKSGSFTFTNSSRFDLPVHFEAADFQSADEDGHVDIGAAEEPANSLKDWLRPTLPEFTVGAGQSVELDFSVDVPLDAAPGGHWGALLVSTEPQSAENGSAVRTRIGLIILVKVLGAMREQVAVESFDAQRYLEAPPILFTARFRNDGTVHETPHGEITIRNVFGRVVATGVLSDRHVLPGAIRKTDASVGTGFWMGRYTAELRATYADGAKSVEARTSFWVMPWKVLAGVAVGLAVAAAIFLMVRRKFRAG